MFRAAWRQGLFCPVGKIRHAAKYQAPLPASGQNCHRSGPKARALGFDVCPATVRASALLHDIAKTYCIRYGGSHAQLGAAWALSETHNYKLPAAYCSMCSGPGPCRMDRKSARCHFSLFTPIKGCGTMPLSTLTNAFRSPDALWQERNVAAKHQGLPWNRAKP